MYRSSSNIATGVIYLTSTGDWLSLLVTLSFPRAIHHILLKVLILKVLVLKHPQLNTMLCALRNSMDKYTFQVPILHLLCKSFVLPLHVVFGTYMLDITYQHSHSWLYRRNCSLEPCSHGPYRLRNGIELSYSPSGSKGSATFLLGGTSSSPQNLSRRFRSLSCKPFDVFVIKKSLSVVFSIFNLSILP